MGPRTKNSAKNIFFSEVSFAVILILQFVNRSLFILYYLSYHWQNWASAPRSISLCTDR